MSEKRERLSAHFAVFNCHVNDAAKRADAEVIAQYGQKAFDEHMRPLHEGGIMAVFNKAPQEYNPIVPVWVALVTCFVNEERRP